MLKGIHTSIPIILFPDSSKNWMFLGQIFSKEVDKHNGGTSSIGLVR